jgi:hypothetical protein
MIPSVLFVGPLLQTNQYNDSKLSVVRAQNQRGERRRGMEKKEELQGRKREMGCGGRGERGRRVGSVEAS